MADNTGAPHFIPYVEPTDLVREYPAADEASAFAVAAALDAIPVLAGIGSNVVSVVKTNTFSTASSDFVNVTGLAVTITPTSATSKILLLATVTLGGGNQVDDKVAWRLTGGNAESFVGDAATGRVSTVSSIFVSDTADARRLHGYNAMFLDSPATASPITYEVQIAGTTGTAFINIGETNDVGDGRGASSITAIEVAA